jgi:hypothetical protein
MTTTVTDDGFRQVAEVEVDGRRRISFGRVSAVREHTRYFVMEGPDGEIRLIPVKSVPAREAIIWENPELLASLKRGLEQAALGKVRPLGSFREYLDDKDDADEDTAD